MAHSCSHIPLLVQPTTFITRPSCVNPCSTSVSPYHHSSRQTTGWPQGQRKIHLSFLYPGGCGVMGKQLRTPEDSLMSKDSSLCKETYACELSLGPVRPDTEGAPSGPGEAAYWGFEGGTSLETEGPRTNHVYTT